MGCARARDVSCNQGRTMGIRSRGINPRVNVLGAMLALLAATGMASAQNFPSRPLTLVVPFAAGGPSDVAGRILAQGLSDVLGQQVVVENPSGAGGTVGSLRVAKAPPDGYQFVIATAAPTPGARRSTRSRPMTRLPTSPRSVSSSSRRAC